MNLFYHELMESMSVFLIIKQAIYYTNYTKYSAFDTLFFCQRSDDRIELQRSGTCL